MATESWLLAAVAAVLVASGCVAAPSSVTIEPVDPGMPAPFTEPACSPPSPTLPGVLLFQTCGLTLRLSDGADSLHALQAEGQPAWTSVRVSSQSGRLLGMLVDNSIPIRLVEEDTQGGLPLQDLFESGAITPGQSVLLCEREDGVQEVPVTISAQNHAVRFSLTGIGTCPPMQELVEVPMIDEESTCEAVAAPYQKGHNTGDVRPLALFDASEDGGVWWFPQYPGEENPASAHQGKRLAGYALQRGLLPIEVAREQFVHGRLMDCSALVVRASFFPRSAEPYSSAELDAYLTHVRSGNKLLLLADHMGNFHRDPLAEAFGLRLEGATASRSTVVLEGEHPTTRGIPALQFIAGSCAFELPPETLVLGRYADGEGCDGGDVALGVFPFGLGEVYFILDTNFLQQIPEPYTSQLFDHLMGSPATT